jgi:hypothetical protein
VTKGGCKTQFVWATSEQKSFDDMKHYIFLSLMHSLPDMKKPFQIETDSLNYVVGVILSQHDYQMTYHIDIRSNVVHKYPTYDKEMYSIVQRFSPME